MKGSWAALPLPTLLGCSAGQPFAGVRVDQLMARVATGDDAPLMDVLGFVLQLGSEVILPGGVWLGPPAP